MKVETLISKRIINNLKALDLSHLLKVAEYVGLQLEDQTGQAEPFRDFFQAVATLNEYFEQAERNIDP